MVKVNKSWKADGRTFYNVDEMWSIIKYVACDDCDYINCPEFNDLTEAQKKRVIRYIVNYYDEDGWLEKFGYNSGVYEYCSYEIDVYAAVRNKKVIGDLGYDIETAAIGPRLHDDFTREHSLPEFIAHIIFNIEIELDLYERQYFSVDGMGNFEVVTHCDSDISDIENYIKDEYSPIVEIECNSVYKDVFANNKELYDYMISNVTNFEQNDNGYYYIPFSKEIEVKYSSSHITGRPLRVGPTIDDDSMLDFDGVPYVVIAGGYEDRERYICISETIYGQLFEDFCALEMA